MPVISLSPHLSFDGSQLRANWQDALTELRIDREYQVPARATLRFSDPGYVLLESDAISLGTMFKASDPTDTAQSLIEAEVTSIGVEQRVGEHPELVIVAHDKSHRLGRSTNVKTYVQMTYSDVVAQMASTCGLMPETQSTELTVDFLMQADSDLGLLTELARRVGFDWWVSGSTLYFKKPSSGTPVELTLGDNLLSFSARASGHHPDQVTVDGWDREQQELVSSTSSSATAGIVPTSNLAGLVSSPGDAFGTGTVMSAGLSPHSATEASQLSQAILDRAKACSVSAEGLASGNSSLSLGSAAHVSQAGPLSGSYPITRVEHILSPRTGFVTRFFGGDRRPTSLVDTLSGARPVATPATVHPGLSVGQVTNINDPENRGRVKVKYPGLSSEYETGWARIVAVGGGSNRGMVFVPEVDDEVLVAFEGGDPRQPVVIGGLYGAKSSIPTTTIEAGKVQKRGFTSRLGHVMQLLDGDAPDQQAIVLGLAGGQNTIHLGKDKLSITVPEGTPVEIVAGAASLKFGSDGAISIQAPSFSVTADQKIALNSPQVNVNADAQLNLQSDGVAALKGATLQVQSEGPLSMTGEPVSIN